MNGSMTPWLEWGGIGLELGPEQLGWTEMTETDWKLFGAIMFSPRPIPERSGWNGIDNYDIYHFLECRYTCLYRCKNKKKRMNELQTETRMTLRPTFRLIKQMGVGRYVHG